nr:Chain E, PEPTIDE FROM COLLAGEN II [Homo sapiens]
AYMRADAAAGGA